MAQKTGEQLKQTLLLLFVGVSVVVIGLTWADSLNGSPQKASAPYRGVPQAVGPTTVVTDTPVAAPAGSTSGPTREHKGHGSSSTEVIQDAPAATPDPLDATSAQ